MHEILGIPYDNPFVWNSIKLSNFCTLIRQYDDINLCNYTVTNEIFLGQPRLTIIADNLIHIYFTHHIQDNNYDKPTKFGGDVKDIRYKNISNYISDKWKVRCSRIQGEPIFIYDDIFDYTDIDIMNFIQLDTLYKKLLITTDSSLKKYETPAMQIYKACK